MRNRKGDRGSCADRALREHSNPTLTEDGVRATLEQFVVDASLVADALVALGCRAALNSRATSLASETSACTATAVLPVAWMSSRGWRRRHWRRS